MWAPNGIWFCLLVCPFFQSFYLFSKQFFFFPSSTKRFPGYDNENSSYSAEVHRNYIYGKHVANYMEYLQGEDEALYQKQFSRFIKQGIVPGSVSFSCLPKVVIVNSFQV